MQAGGHGVQRGCKEGAGGAEGVQGRCRGGCRGSREAAEGSRELQGLCRRFGAQELRCRQGRAGGCGRAGCRQDRGRATGHKGPQPLCMGTRAQGCTGRSCSGKRSRTCPVCPSAPAACSPALRRGRKQAGGTPGRGDLRASGHPRVHTGPGDKTGERDLPGVGVCAGGTQFCSRAAQPPCFQMLGINLVAGVGPNL